MIWGAWAFALQTSREVGDVSKRARKGVNMMDIVWLRLTTPNNQRSKPQSDLDHKITYGTGGSRDDCIVVGAREGGALESTPNDMALTNDVDGQDMLSIQEAIRTDPLKLKWHGMYGRVYKWQRLHHWAVKNYAN